MSHYSPAQKHALLAEWVDDTADYLMRHFPQLKDGRWTHGHPVLIYRGMSGIACATALAQELWRSYKASIPMCYVRKEDEVSHGSSVETEVDWEHVKNGRKAIRFVPVFVDDFVSSGLTLQFTLTAADRKLRLDLDYIHVLQANAGYNNMLVTGETWATETQMEEWHEYKGRCLGYEQLAYQDSLVNL